ncbi:MAG: IS1380 family transposase [Solirubrobacterales bacterium]|nr:IS1380 family transposase [Solirubrobacterales bacterium]
MRDGRPVTVEVTADGPGLVSHAGTALLGQVADKLGLTSALSVRLAAIKQRRRGHDPGRVLRDLAVMLADGGECVSDLGATRDQDALFGKVASDSTAFRMVDRIASTPGLLAAVRDAHARARACFWELHGAPERLTIDVDATLIIAHSEKEKAAGNYKHGYGFHPLGAYADETREALAMLLRPGNAGSNTAADHKTVIDLALAQIPAEQIESIAILVRADSAGATHETADHCHEGNLRFSFGYELTETVRAAILETPDEDWIAALDQDGSVRENGEVVELTDRLDLSTWPKGSRLIVRRERPHPGAQLSFTDHDGYRFQAILTDQSDPEVAVLERRHRQRARVEDRIRDDKDTGLAKLPFKAFALNEVWLEIVMLAHDLLVWTQALALNGELAKAEPKRLRYRLLHVAARLAFSGRRGKLHLPAAWPWTEALKAAFEKLETLPAASG